MSLFSRAIVDYWQGTFLAGNLLYRDDVFSITANPDLEENSRIMVLETADGKTMAVLRPELAERFDFSSRSSLSIAGFRRELREAGLSLHDADYVFYFSHEARSALLREASAGSVRHLTQADSAAFAEFQASASEQDLDNAYVELDHWAVFGAFAEERLVSVASMYPWDETQIADLGVLTLAPFRGKGLARKVVRAICRHASEQGYEPQYRCQLDNQASVALAATVDLTLFGKWQPISPEAMA